MSESSFSDYMRLLYEKAYFDFTEMINLAVQFLEADPDEDEDAAARPAITSATTSATSSSTSTRTSTRSRSGLSGG